MADTDFTIEYLKKQEAFLLDVTRRCVEAEANLSLLQNKHKELQSSHNLLNEQLTQVLAGLESTTNERNVIREEHAKYRDEILALGDLKEKCEKIEKNYEDHMKNYNLVNEAYQKLQDDYQKLLEAKPTKNAKSEQQKKDDWG